MLVAVLLLFSYATISLSVVSVAAQGTSLQDTLENSNVDVPDNLPTLGIEGEEDPITAVESVLVNYIINPIFLIAGGVATVVIMYSAFRVISSRGEEEGMEAAKKSLIWAFVGLGLVMLSYTIVSNMARIILQLF